MSYTDSGLLRMPDITFTVKSTDAHVYLDALQKGLPVRVTLPQWVGRAFVIDVRRKYVDHTNFINIDGQSYVAPVSFPTADITLRPTGAPDVPNSALPGAMWPTGMLRRAMRDAERQLVHGHPNCRCLPVGITTKEKTVIKKFYVGRPEVAEGKDHNKWGKDTLADAITHAKDLARTTGRPQYVVKVIKVVARQEPPVSVKDVK